ncbi:MAG TPA: Bax inhibitor-1 family protein [Gammaproteobacteria bacterium]|nr:Bax inhibitor-1 family protein [Gammaproteobacteria bacterium]
MSTLDTVSGNVVAYAPAEVRGAFVRRAYLHAIGGIVGFAAIEWYLFSSGLALPILETLMAGSWLLVLGGFLLVSWIATHVAHRVRSVPAQYAAFAALVVAEAIIFVPLLAMAMIKAPGVIESAAWVTLMGATGLIVVATVTGKDFSFLRGILMWGGVLALVAIVSAVLFGFEIGTWFSVAMIGFAGAAILYDTSNILHHYPEDRYVAAGMQLFASIALMFWYVLRLFMSRD